MHSRNDHTAPPESAEYVFEHAGAIDKEIVWYDRSYHVITMDYDRDDVFARTFDFIKERSKSAL